MLSQLAWAGSANLLAAGGTACLLRLLKIASSSSAAAAAAAGTRRQHRPFSSSTARLHAETDAARQEPADRAVASAKQHLKVRAGSCSEVTPWCCSADVQYVPMPAHIHQTPARCRTLPSCHGSWTCRMTRRQLCWGATWACRAWSLPACWTLMLTRSQVGHARDASTVKETGAPWLRCASAVAPVAKLGHVTTQQCEPR